MGELFMIILTFLIYEVSGQSATPPPLPGNATLPTSFTTLSAIAPTDSPAQGIWRSVTSENFTKIADGVFDAWKKADPENVSGGRFNIQASGHRLWMVSRRQYRKNAKDPWDAASRGGIVSNLNLESLNWTHSPYDQLDVDNRGEKTFGVNGRLFMLTYSTNTSRIVFHRLFLWSDRNGTWSEMDFKAEPGATTDSTSDFVRLIYQVPYSGVEEIAYFAASVHGIGPNAMTEVAFSKLDILYDDDGVPINATLKSIGSLIEDRPLVVVSVGHRLHRLIAFVDEYTSDGYVSVTNAIYVVRMDADEPAKRLNVTGPPPPMSFDEDRMVQYENGFYIAGGKKRIGLTQSRTVFDIWLFDIANVAWRNTTLTLPVNAGDSAAYEPGFLYIAGLKEGVGVAYFPDVK